MLSIGPGRGHLLLQCRISSDSLFLFLLGWETFDRDCCEDLTQQCQITAGEIQGNTGSQPLQGAVLCQQSGIWWHLSHNILNITACSFNRRKWSCEVPKISQLQQWGNMGHCKSFPSLTRSVFVLFSLLWTYLQPFPWLLICWFFVQFMCQHLRHSLTFQV